MTAEEKAKLLTGMFQGANLEHVKNMFLEIKTLRNSNKDIKIYPLL